MIRLTKKTSTSRSKIILVLLIVGSAYLAGMVPIPILIRNKIKSITVHATAMTKMVLISFLFTTDPRGSTSLEVFIFLLSQMLHQTLVRSLIIQIDLRPHSEIERSFMWSE